MILQRNVTGFLTKEGNTFRSNYVAINIDEGISAIYYECFNILLSTVEDLDDCFCKNYNAKTEDIPKAIML